MNNEKAKIIDLSFSEITKQKFRIDGDDARILELDISDMSVVDRFQSVEDRLVSVKEKLSKASANSSDIAAMDSAFSEADAEMRNIVDYIFDSNVSEVCAPKGTMFDPINGKFRYEHIIDKLLSLYEENLRKETAKVNARIKSHTGKYIKK